MDLAKASVPPVVAEKRTNRFLSFRQILHGIPFRDDAASGKPSKKHRTP